jgi:hypothetical protein
MIALKMLMPLREKDPLKYLANKVVVVCFNDSYRAEIADF